MSYSKVEQNNKKMRWKPQATQDVQNAYRGLAALSKKFNTESPYHNWQTTNILSFPTIVHILALDTLYKKIISVPGGIYEFGCHVGSTSSILYQLRCYYEPLIYREFHLYDTFSCIPGDSGHYDYALPEGYDETLGEIFEYHARITQGFARECPTFVHRGDIRELVPTTIERHSPIAMVVIDVDNGSTVRHILDSIRDFTVPGTLIVYGGVGPTVPDVYEAIRSSQYGHLPLRSADGMTYLKYVVCI